MGKGSSPPPPPPPIPPVIAQNPAGDGQAAYLRRRASQQGINYEDTILGGSYGSQTLGSAGTLLGQY